MAISRVPGAALLSDLDRQGIDLQFTTSGNSLVYMDFANFYVGINEESPSQSLTVNGNTLVSNGHIFTSGNLTYDIGTVTNQWNGVYANLLTGTLLTNAQPHITSVGTLTNLTVEGDFVAGNINIANLVINGDSIIDAGNNQIINLADPLTSTDAATKNYVDSQIAGTAFGNLIGLGTPTDGNISFPGAYDGWTPSTSITDAVDDLNEMMENVRNNTFVKSVTFTGSPTTGGEGTEVTLTLSVNGNANRYDIDWGDGETPTTGTTDTTPSHTYSNNALSPFTVTVTAYNNSGSGTGSSAESTRTDYIVIYTANPVVGFGLYRASTGGSALSGNDLYVTEGETFYLDNDTTNTTMATVEYEVNYGDGAGNVNVADDSADGGVSGNRLAYTYGYSSSSGTGTRPVTLYLTSHTTADPNVIPTSSTVNLKVYDANIAAPSGLSTKTISFSGSTGTSPYLAANFTDNTGGTSLSAGQAVSRTVATGTTAVQTVTTTTYAYDASSGTLSALVNGVYSGNITLTSGNDATTTGNLQLVAESDYNLLNAGGASVSFASSIYAPGLFTGFTARVTRTGGSISKGVNSFQLTHSSTGNTNTVEFVKDDLTSAPTVSNVGSLTELSGGTKRYVSGIPYYNTGSPTLRISGAEISNFVGQTYRFTSTPVQVVSGTNAEGTSSSAISTQSYTYAQIDGAVSMLSGGIPIADTGVGSAYAIGNLTVSVTSSSVRTVETLGLLAYNVNGTSSTVQTANKVQVHTASQSGISEIAIAVSDSLGNGTYLDDGVRIFDFNAATTNTPTFNGATNFYTNNPYTESSDPGVEGTKEATIRIGTLKHDVTDYSTGYLPVGPDRSGDTGTQYFTFAFRRQVVSNFDINITSSGIAGLWIAAPGTQIDDASGLNGWLDASTTYAGSGVPGSDTGNGGNGSDGCAFTSGDRIQASTALSGGYTMTLGSENMTNATGNVVLVRIALTSGQSVTALSIGVAS